MSKLSNPLPLPQANQILKERADLLTAWEAINDWYGEAVSPTGLYHGDGYRHFAGPIILALKYLVLESRPWAKKLAQESSETKQGLARAINAVINALQWAQQQPGVDALNDEFKSSLALTVFTANSDYDWLILVDQVNLLSTSS